MFSLLSKWSLVRPQSAVPDLAKLVRETLFYARNPFKKQAHRFGCVACLKRRCTPAITDLNENFVGY